MIDPVVTGDSSDVPIAAIATSQASENAPVVDRAGHDRRVRQMVDDNFDFIWRSLVRFGVRRADADDVAQKVFLVAAEKLSSIAIGAERSFLFGTAIRIASRARRGYGRERSVACDDLDVVGDSAPGPEILTDQKRLRAAADAILEEMEMDLRVVLVLHDVEEMTAPDIGRLLEIPTGTVASRLRRAREDFQQRVALFLQGPSAKGRDHE